MSGWNEEDFESEETAESVLEEIEEEARAAEQVEDQAEEAWLLAMQKIEEANLFKLLIKQPVFTQDSASPRILNAVNNKIKMFAIRELESLLGIKPKDEEVKSPFSKDETEALRLLASKVLKKDYIPTAQKVEIKPATPSLAPIEQPKYEPSFAEIPQPKLNSSFQPPPKKQREPKKITPAPIPQTSAPTQTKKSVNSVKKAESKNQPGRPKPIPQPNMNQTMMALAAKPQGFSMTEGSQVRNLSPQALGIPAGGALAVDSRDPADSI